MSSENLKWTISSLNYSANVPLVENELKIRTGILKENPNVPFKGNILYLEGLGDSMLNHDPFFKKLVEKGFRVISFDYMGQGGSEGTMNHTRVIDYLFPTLNISTIAKQVWEKLRRKDSNQRIVIGWSTGGLAAYELANQGWAQTVIMIAPGICPNIDVGTGLFHGNKITLETLTSAATFFRNNPEKDPHVDPIKPSSPLTVPLFAANLIKVGSFQAKKWKIPSQVRGLVALSGANDTYVDSTCARQVLKRGAAKFRIISYPGALHEIDNEIPEIRNQFYADVEGFIFGTLN